MCENGIIGVKRPEWMEPTKYCSYNARSHGDNCYPEFQRWHKWQQQYIGRLLR